MTGGHERKFPLELSERGSRQPLDEGVAIAADALFIDGKQVARRAKAILDAFMFRGLDDLSGHAIPGRCMALHGIGWHNLHHAIDRPDRGAIVR
jgi:hypothetical protein